MKSKEKKMKWKEKNSTISDNKIHWTNHKWWYGCSQAAGVEYKQQWQNRNRIDVARKVVANNSHSQLWLAESNKVVQLTFQTIVEYSNKHILCHRFLRKIITKQNNRITAKIPAAKYLYKWVKKKKQ